MLASSTGAAPPPGLSGSRCSPTMPPLCYYRAIGCRDIDTRKTGERAAWLFKAMQIAGRVEHESHLPRRRLLADWHRPRDALPDAGL